MELVLQPVIVILAVGATVAGARLQDKKIQNICEVLLVLLVLWLLIYSVRQTYLRWGQIDKQSLFLELGLPIWLTLGIIPFLFLFSIVLAYDSAFRRINALDAQSTAKWRAGVTLFCSFHVRFRDPRGFSAYWLNNLAEAASFLAAREVVREFRQRRRETALAEQAKLERLRRNAGMRGTANSSAAIAADCIQSPNLSGMNRWPEGNIALGREWKFKEIQDQWRGTLRWFFPQSVFVKAPEESKNEWIGSFFLGE